MILKLFGKYARFAKWGAIAISIGVVVYFIYDYTKSKELLNQVTNANIALEYRIDNVKNQVDQQNQQLNLLRNDYQQIELQYKQQVDEIDQLRLLTNDYIQNNQPSVQGELNYKFQLYINQIQCLSGDQTKCEQPSS